MQPETITQGGSHTFREGYEVIKAVSFAVKSVDVSEGQCQASFCRVHVLDWPACSPGASFIITPCGQNRA